ncbi:uncharacterized protein LOC128548187 [Mercenaria mercenaria]|uniref:uncharacterized protein LOC128548187 n=1 Tax=Mercenaria mercenaria TaxID=6596 RepID=UPI00234F1F8E|nr:uncharacterized protein LOC128548187 [Mercenaria mercenaria]
MEKRHKELLILQRANLVEDLNMRSGLFTQLLCRKIIDQRMVRKIKNGNTEDEQAEELLDYLPKSDQGAKTFDLFCEALIADSQSNVVKSYLKPENKKESDENKTVQESAESIGDTSSQAGGQTCVHVAEGVEYRDGDRSVASPSHVPNIAIREEFQSQMYRRSIEPRDLHHSLSSPNLPNSSEHEARFFYQNSLRNPNAVYTVLNDRCINKMEKEKQLFNMGLPVASISQIMNDYHMQNNNDPLLVRDSGSKILPKCASSKDFSQNAFAQPPPVFGYSPHKEINVSSMNSSFGPSPQKSFAFHTRDQTYSPVLQESDFISAKKGYGIGTIKERELEIENIYSSSKQNEKLFNEKIGSCYEGYDESMRHKVSAPQVSEIRSSPSRFSDARNVMEMDRYIEVNNSSDGSQHRSMISFPRHVTMLPVSHHPDLRSEESFRGDDSRSPRLMRNDSVDTMQKRPLSEEVETGGKFFKPVLVHFLASPLSSVGTTLQQQNFWEI